MIGSGFYNLAQEARQGSILFGFACFFTPGFFIGSDEGEKEFEIDSWLIYYQQIGIDTLIVLIITALLRHLLGKKRNKSNR